jgi:hypothetical protein
MRRLIVLLATVVLVFASNPVQAHMLMAPMPTAHRTAAPSSLVIGEQYFDASVGGLRSYLESIKSSDPNLYMQLDPKLAHLERRRDLAVVVLVTGLILDLGSTIYAFVGRNSCHEPSINDPNFAAGSDAWGRCNSENVSFSTTFILLGLGAGVAAGIGAYALSPSRSALFDLVNEHNRLNHEPLRWQLGYDPTHQTAYGRLRLAF